MCKKIISMILVFVMMSGLSAIFAGAETVGRLSYQDYRKEHENVLFGTVELAIVPDSYIGAENAEIPPFAERDGAISWSNGQGEVTYRLEVPADGLYNISMTYYPMPGSLSGIELGLKIDGNYPFSESQSCFFSRVFKDATVIRTDKRGNQYSPEIEELPQWLTGDFIDGDGIYGNEPFAFFLTAGQHEIALVCEREVFAIGEIKFYKKESEKSYNEALSEWKSAGFKEIETEELKYEAEETYRKSDASLRPLSDRSGPMTTPYDVSKIRLNYIGGENWRYQNQWLEWKITAPEEGLYHIGFRYEQPYVRGFFVTRKLMLNGELPFAEAQRIRFDYSFSWRFGYAGGNDPYLFYLKKGENILRLEVVTGELSGSLNTLETVVSELSTLYRRIIMITGSNPDPFRDYNLDRELPGMTEILSESAAFLREQRMEIGELTGDRESDTVILQTLAQQLEAILERPNSISEKARLDNFYSNIGSLSAWILDLKFQPLDIDSIYVLTPGAEQPRVKAGFFAQLVHEVSAFVMSFFEDYNSMGSDTEGQSIDLWLNWGRDQGRVLKSTVDDLFTPSTGIGVNIHLMQTTLVQAVLSGSCPDVSVMVARGQPVNMALRNSLVDLTKFSDFSKISGRFMDGACVPYEIGESCYALPDTQRFFMMFYRKDIFDELELEPPETWDELLKISSVLQRSNMQAGLPYASIDAWGAVDQGIGEKNIFPALLYQSGAEFYTQDRKKSNLSAPAALEAFKQWTAFYSLYDFPVSYDFYNRFRTGEMPIALAPYTEYNRFVVAAPEIKGLFEMIPIPGTRRPDGTIDRTEAGSGTGAIIFAQSERQDAAWEFLKWWTSSEAQQRFGQGMEMMMGAAGRHATSNLDAFSRQAWTRKDKDGILSQWSQIKEIPEVAGGYYTSRNLENAFTEVTVDRKNPREVFNKWSRDIDKEIALKRDELGLD